MNETLQKYPNAIYQWNSHFKSQFGRFYFDNPFKSRLNNLYNASGKKGENKKMFIVLIAFMRKIRTDEALKKRMVFYRVLKLQNIFECFKNHTNAFYLIVLPSYWSQVR